MLDNGSKVENDATKISDLSNNQSKNSNGLTIITKSDIHHLAINKNDKEIKEYLVLLYFNMFSPWEPELLMDVFMLTEYQQDYDIIKYMNEGCVQTIFIDPQKYPVCTKFNGEGYSLLCKELATSAINQGYQMARNGFYVVGGLTANRFQCSICIQYKGDMKC